MLVAELHLGKVGDSLNVHEQENGAITAYFKMATIGTVRTSELDL